MSNPNVRCGVCNRRISVKVYGVHVCFLCADKYFGEWQEVLAKKESNGLKWEDYLVGRVVADTLTKD